MYVMKRYKGNCSIADTISESPQGNKWQMEELMCKICHKIFNYTTNREWHEKTCSGDPNLPYKCQQCGKKLKSKDALKKHKKIHKTHSVRLFLFFIKCKLSLIYFS